MKPAIGWPHSSFEPPQRKTVELESDATVAALIDVRILAPGSEWREPGEQAIVDAGLHVPMMYRAAAARAGAAEASTLLVVRDAGGRCLGGLAVSTKPAALAPGHRTARVERLGGSLAPEAVAPAIRAVLDFVRRDPRILRVNVEVFSHCARHRAALAQALRQAGFVRAIEPDCYAATLAVDLSPDIDAVFASFERSARRNIRATSRHPVAVRPIDDPSLGGRMNDLVREALARTGGRAHVRAWGEIITFSLANPSLSRLVGFFRTDTTGSDALVAFAWGRAHGDHVEYADSGSVRPADLRIALSYALVWDLIVWARGIGARWFDLGGVTRGSREDGTDRLGGISDFKRFFSDQVLDVGEEWVFTPPTARARAARAVHAGIVRHRKRAAARAVGGQVDNVAATAYPPPRAGALIAPRGDVAEMLRGFDLHASGSAALYAALRSTMTPGAAPGTARPIVWIPAYHCGIEVQAAIDAGLDVGFYRIDEDLRADTGDLAARLAARPGTVLLIHYFGFAQPHADAVAALCGTAGVSLIEDCAHALFTPIARRDERRDITAIYSLQKFLGVFDGGAVRWGQPAGGARAGVRLAHRTHPHVRPYVVAVKTLGRAVLGNATATLARRLLAGSGRLTGGPVGEIGHPSIPSERRYDRGMSALSQALAGAEHRTTVSSRRRENYQLLESELSGQPGFVPVFPGLPSNCVPLVLPVRVAQRAEVVAKLENAGVVPYVFGEFPHPILPLGDFPDARELSARILGLPVHQGLDSAKMRQMARSILPILADDAAAANALDRR